jgi:hypothetical protein
MWEETSWTGHGRLLNKLRSLQVRDCTYNDVHRRNSQKWQLSFLINRNGSPRTVLIDTGLAVTALHDLRPRP